MSNVEVALDAEEKRDAKKVLGVWLKERRMEAGLSQSQLAAALKLHNKTFISQIELGRGRVPFDRCTDWADALLINRSEFSKHLLRSYEPTLYDALFSTVDH